MSSGVMQKRLEAVGLKHSE